MSAREGRGPQYFRSESPCPGGTVRVGDKYLSKTVLAVQPLSDHPGDDYLRIVLCLVHGTFDCEFVTWLVNLQSGGFFEGHYFREGELRAAVEDFHARRRS